MAKDFWLEKVGMPFETYIFDAPDNADVEIFGLDQQLARHYRIEDLLNYLCLLYFQKNSKPTTI